MANLNMNTHEAFRLNGKINKYQENEFVYRFLLEKNVNVYGFIHKGCFNMALV